MWVSSTPECNRLLLQKNYWTVKRQWQPISLFFSCKSCGSTNHVNTVHGTEISLIGLRVVNPQKLIYTPILNIKDKELYIHFYVMTVHESKPPKRHDSPQPPSYLYGNWRIFQQWTFQTLHCSFWVDGNVISKVGRQRINLRVNKNEIP